MSNKKMVKNIFEQKFSANNNYQVIMRKLNNKKEVRNYYFKWSLVPKLATILIVISMIFVFSDNRNIYINNLADSKLPKAVAIDVYLSKEKEYVIEKDFPFVKDILIPTDLNNKEEGIIYLDNSDELDIRDYIMVYYNKKNGRSIKISFSKQGVESLVNDSLDIENLKTSSINGNKVIIALLNNTYYAEFKYQDLSFNIKTNNIKSKELINIIKSILK